MEISEFKEYINSHRPTSWGSISDYNKEIISPDIAEIIRLYNPTEIYLCGSYATGMELNLDTPEPIREFLIKHLRKKISDRDYYLVPTPNILINHGQYQILPFKPIHSFLIWSSLYGLMP